MKVLKIVLFLLVLSVAQTAVGNLLGLNQIMRHGPYGSWGSLTYDLMMLISGMLIAFYQESSDVR